MKIKKLQKELKTEQTRVQRAGEVLTEITGKTELAAKVFDECRVRLKEARKQAKLAKKKFRATEKLQRAARKEVKASKRRVERLEKKLQRALPKSKPAAKASTKPEPRRKKAGVGKDTEGAERKAA